MPKTANKLTPKVIVSIKPAVGTPNQCRLWAKFWQKLIGETRTQAGKPKDD